MEELIYLAVVVGWFLLNAYKKSQAKKQQEQQRTPQHERRQQEEYAPEEPSTVEDLLRQLMGEEPRTPEPLHVPAPVAAPRPVREAQPMRAAYQMPAPVRTSRLTPRTPVRRENARTKQQAAPEETWDVNPLADARFDLRNAIVYSAILQRPYA